MGAAPDRPRGRARRGIGAGGRAQPGHSPRRVRGLASLLPALLAPVLVAACRISPPEDAAFARASSEVASLFALGDTGQEPGFVRGAHRQLQVAAALAAEDDAAPADALLLLGDNFYPKGLSEVDFEDRLGANVVRPYCRFLRFTPRGARRMEAHCPQAGRARRAGPLLAVLGNHDYGRRESPHLQHARIPRYVANWWLPRPGRVARVRELPGGLSVVLLHSQAIREGAGAEPLVAALRRAEGPWRILAAHHPIADVGHGFDRRYARAVRRAIARAGVTVHLVLAAHEHSLQVAAPEGGRAAPLVVVAGGGFEAEALRAPAPDRLFGVAETGFVRVAVVPDEEGEALHVTVLAVETGLLAEPRALPRARFVVERRGVFGRRAPERAW